jgi:hypothetical protein
LGKNAISVFAYGSRTDLDTAAVALSIGRSGAKSFRYLIIHGEDIQTLGLRCSPTPDDGTTPIPEANLLHWTLELSEIEAQELVRLAFGRYQRAPRKTDDEFTGSVTKGELKRLVRANPVWRAIVEAHSRYHWLLGFGR